MQRLVVGANQLRGDQLWLTPEQQHYLYRVLRLTTGSQFIALDGQGQHWLAQLGPEPGMAIARPQVVEALARPTITLAIALRLSLGKFSSDSDLHPTATLLHQAVQAIYSLSTGVS